MAGTIAELFGYQAQDVSAEAQSTIATRLCPFLNAPCTKILARDRTPSGVCAIRQRRDNAPAVICCPNRLYAGGYAILHDVTRVAFHRDIPLFAGRAAVSKARELGEAIAVFGHGWGGELRLPQRNGAGAYFVDWVLARLNPRGELEEFTAVEVQTIDTTGSYRTAREALLGRGEVIADTVGLNWENVAKRIIPQVIYKGQVLQREDLCRTGLFFVSPRPVHERVLKRLGGESGLPRFPTQPASIHFVAYDYDVTLPAQNGQPRPLRQVDRLSTTVYKVQEAFSSVSLPNANVYQTAINNALHG